MKSFKISTVLAILLFVPIFGFSQLKIGPVIGSNILKTQYRIQSYQIGVSTTFKKHNISITWDIIIPSLWSIENSNPKGFQLLYQYNFLELPLQFSAIGQCAIQYFSYFSEGFTSAKSAQNATSGDLVDTGFFNLALGFERELINSLYFSFSVGGGRLFERSFNFDFNRFSSIRSVNNFRFQAIIRYQIDVGVGK